MPRARSHLVPAAVAVLAAGAAVLTAPAANADPTFGQGQTIALSAPVPSGWLVDSQNPAAGTKHIEYLGGAIFGAQVYVLPNQAAPANWVLAGVYPSGTAILQYLGGVIPNGITQTMDQSCQTSIGTVWGYSAPAYWIVTGGGNDGICDYKSLRYSPRPY
ncbi:hypothetical protein GCM10009839_65790 [Catenulispora yoronensis]|uniref:Uncharacterized protein n=1 Tax=Catenulispora yoronensis TaxID=450799 RepID=A0ABN2V479_9ACTN